MDQTQNNTEEIIKENAEALEVVNQIYKKRTKEYSKMY